MFHIFFSMSKHPWECMFICNSVPGAQRIDEQQQKSVSSPRVQELLHVSAQKLLQTISPCNPAESRLSLKPAKSACAHPPVGAAYSSLLILSSFVDLSCIFCSLCPGHQESSSFQPCNIGVGSCPAMCTCSNNIVDCRGKGLTAIPANLPDTMAEM